MKLLKIGRVAGCDWTANGPQVSANGRRGLRYGTRDAGDGETEQQVQLEALLRHLVKQSTPARQP